MERNTRLEVMIWMNILISKSRNGRITSCPIFNIVLVLKVIFKLSTGPLIDRVF